MVTADFIPEAEFMLFLRMHAKEIAKSLGKCIPIEELFPYHRNSTSHERMTRSDFRPKVPKLPFPLMCSEKYAQDSLTILSNRHNFSAFIGNRGR